MVDFHLQLSHNYKHGLKRFSTAFGKLELNLLLYLPQLKNCNQKKEKETKRDMGVTFTVLSLTTSSLVGTSREPQTRSTSSRASTCQCGCIASKTVVHVIKLDVVCFPAKKKLLHSSTMSLYVIDVFIV